MDKAPNRDSDNVHVRVKPEDVQLFGSSFTSIITNLEKITGVWRGLVRVRGRNYWAYYIKGEWVLD